LQQFIIALGCWHSYWSKDQLGDGEHDLSGSDEQRCALNNAGLAARDAVTSRNSSSVKL
jgi:hypothetical protein